MERETDQSKTTIYILRGDPNLQDGAWGSKKDFKAWLDCKNSESEQEEGVPCYWTIDEALEDAEICDILTADTSVLEWLLSHKEACSLGRKQWDLVKKRMGDSLDADDALDGDYLTESEQRKQVLRCPECGGKGTVGGGDQCPSCAGSGFAVDGE